MLLVVDLKFELQHHVPGPRRFRIPGLACLNFQLLELVELPLKGRGAATSQAGVVCCQCARLPGSCCHWQCARYQPEHPGRLGPMLPVAEGLMATTICFQMIPLL
jgi:hypothetical protein